MSKKGGARAPVDDSDLEDLLQHKGGETVESAPLNLDHLTKGQLDVPRRSGPGLTVLASAHCRYLCYMYPRCCGCMSIVALALAMFLMIGSMLNPTETFGVIENDYTSLNSEYQLSLGKIDHWCIKGDNDSCRCEDPLEPNSRIEFKTWNDAHKANKNKVEAFRDSDYLDVAFLGESLVEEMDGHWMGRQPGAELKSIGEVFKKQFKREESGMDGVALGIAGDTCPNVLWRILHGEMPSDFNPRVWWLVLGLNDLGRMQCSEEVVILGILRVVEEIRSRKPNAEIVINSMLPMADFRGGDMPGMMDYRDAFRPLKGRGASLNAMANAAAVKGVPKITYQRPQTTTKALHKRNSASRGAPISVNVPGTVEESTPDGDGDRQLKKKVEKEEKPNKKKDEAKARKEEKQKEKEAEKQEKQDEKKEKIEAKKAAIAEKKFIKKIKKDPVNPKLNLDITKIKARDPKKLFLAKNRLPLWTSIDAINKQLRKFADNNDKITFFDATNIFAEKDEGNKYVLQSDKISIRGHPTLLGFQEWEEAIAKRLKQMFEKADEELAKEAAAIVEAEKPQEDKAPEDNAPEDKAPEDKAPEVKAQAEEVQEPASSSEDERAGGEPSDKGESESTSDDDDAE